jgi:hypothetical protein
MYFFLLLFYSGGKRKKCKHYNGTETENRIHSALVTGMSFIAVGAVTIIALLLCNASTSKVLETAYSQVTPHHNTFNSGAPQLPDRISLHCDFKNGIDLISVQVHQ